MLNGTRLQEDYVLAMRTFHERHRSKKFRIRARQCLKIARHLKKKYAANPMSREIKA